VEFGAAWDKARQLGVDALEDEAHRRAFEGNEKTVFHQGAECGTGKRVQRHAGHIPAQGT
jgi:hypothetical protein